MNAFTRWKNLPPVTPELTAFEAEVLADTIENRLATFEGVDREDLRMHRTLVSIRDKVAKARGAAR